MQNVIVAVDLAKDVFEVAVAKRAGRTLERRRMGRAQFERFWQLREPCAVAMEACGRAHHWSRQLIASVSRSRCCHRSTCALIGSGIRRIGSSVRQCSRCSARPSSSRWR
jgi:hypothetical protein